MAATDNSVYAGSDKGVSRSKNGARFDIAILDIQMPDMDGLEATRHICRQWPRESRPRIVAMTANAMQGDREKCIEVGMDDYIAKPINPEELVHALQQARPLSEPIDLPYADGFNGKGGSTRSAKRKNTAMQVEKEST